MCGCGKKPATIDQQHASQLAAGNAPDPAVVPELPEPKDVAPSR